MTEVRTVEINDARLEIVPDRTAVGDRLTEVYLARVALTPALNTITPTGESPLLHYSNLVEHEEAHPGTFADVSFWNLDEYCFVDEYGCRLIDPLDQRSYRYFMNQFVPRLGIKPQNSHFPGPENYKRPGSYDALIEQSGGIDFAKLGLGPDHAAGFNFSGSSRDSVTRVVEVSNVTRHANGVITDVGAEAIPEHAITMGVGTVLKAKEIWTIAFGERKQEPVYRAVHDEISAANPATFFREHPNHTFLIDEAAAALLH